MIFTSLTFILQLFWSVEDKIHEIIMGFVIAGLDTCIILLIFLSLPFSLVSIEQK